MASNLSAVAMTAATTAGEPADDIELMLARYLDAEREIYKITGPRTIQLSGSRLFNDNGFPHACLTKRNLGYYLDSQQENRAAWYIRSIGDIDEATATIVREALQVLTKVNADTVGAGGGISGMMHGLYCALNIQKILPKPTPEHPVHTLEIGPGSGWTTYFLTRFGFHTTTIDSNPNLITTQRYLMSQLPPDNAAHYVQLPWWKFYDIDFKPAQAFDIIIANHMICEIPHWSRLYIAKWASVYLKANGVVFLQAWGDESFCTRYDAIDDFKTHRIWPYVRKKAPSRKEEFLEIILMKKMPERTVRPADSIGARIRKKLLCSMPRIGRRVHQMEHPVMDMAGYRNDDGVSLEKIVREEGFTEAAYTDPSFLWCGICH